MREFKYALILIMAISIYSCGGEYQEPTPDVSHINIQSQWHQFDKAIADLDTNSLEASVDRLKLDFPGLFDIYFKRVLPIKGKTEDEFVHNLRGYLTEPKVRHIIDTTAIIHADFEREVLPKIHHGLKLMKHYFPDYEEPNIYTLTSEYGIQQFLFQDGDRDGLGISLDLYLGENYPYKKIDPRNEAFSAYLTRAFNKEHLPKKVFEIIVDDKVGPSPGSRLLDHMITNGKKLFVLEKILPSIPDSVLFEYTELQTEWVKDNELEMWAYFFDKDLFYESNALKINKYIKPSPRSPGMPDAAPGRTANYMGYQIVKAFMKRNPEITVQQLIDFKDTQKIMDKSKYKPRRK